MTSQPKAPDGGWGWVIALCSFVNHIFLLGSITSFSVLYVSWLCEFGKAKSATSWIISICTSVMFLSGPIASTVASKLGYRLSTVMGGIVACSGLVLSFFATSVSYLMVSIGFISGFGYGLVYLSSLANVVIYFDKKRALATCIGTSGAGVGSFVMAPLLNGLTEAYGWRGAILITGGLALHLCVTGMLMRPLVLSDNFDAVEESSQKTLERGKQERYGLLGEEKRGERSFEQEKEETELFKRFDRVVDVHFANAHVNVPRSAEDEDKKLPYEDNHQAPQCKPVESDTFCCGVTPPSHIDNVNPDNTLLSKPINEQDGDVTKSDSKPMRTTHGVNKHDKNSGSSTSHKPIGIPTRKCKLNNKLQCCFRCLNFTRLKQNVKSIFHKNKEVVKEPAFSFLALSQILVCMSSIAPIIFMVDRAIHNNIAKNTAVWLISIYGLGSLTGRLFFGMLADKYMTNHLITYIILLNVSGIATMLSPLCAGSFILNGMYAGFFGFCMGGVASLIIIVIVDVMGLTRVAITLGLLLFCAGLGHFVGPPIGGFVYDLTGSYTLSYVCQGLFLTLSGGILFPVYYKRSRRRKDKNCITVTEQRSCRQASYSHENLKA